MTPDQEGIILLIDTSLQGAALGLLRQTVGAHGDPDLLWTGIESQPSAALVVLSDMVQKALISQKLTLKDIAGIGVSVGPGSFTGMRIGLSYAYGLGHGLKATPGQGSFRGFLGLSSLEAAAWELAINAKTSVTLVIPSTRTHGFWTRVSPDGQVIQKASLLDTTARRTPDVCTPWDFVDPDHNQVVVFGSWPAFEQKHRVHDAPAPQTPMSPIAPMDTITSQDLCLKALQGMARLVQRTGLSSFSDAHPEPLFLRLSTAEEQRLASPPLISSPFVAPNPPVAQTEELP